MDVFYNNFSFRTLNTSLISNTTNNKLDLFVNENFSIYVICACEASL